MTNIINTQQLKNYRQFSSHCDHNLRSKTTFMIVQYRMKCTNNCCQAGLVVSILALIKNDQSLIGCCSHVTSFKPMSVLFESSRHCFAMLKFVSDIKLQCYWDWDCPMRNFSPQISQVLNNPDKSD